MMKETVLDCDFLILNRLPELYSAKRFQSEIKRLNRKAQLVTPEWFIKNTSQFKTRDLGLGVLYRQGEFNFWSTQLALMNLPFNIINAPSAFIKARDKWMTAKDWQKQEVPMPDTSLLTDFISDCASVNFAILFQTIKNNFGLPFILKKRFSSQGHGVFLINDEMSLAMLIEQDSKVFLNSTQQELDYFKTEFDLPTAVIPPKWIQLRRWLVQECIQESLGRDTRVFLIRDHKFSILRHNKRSFRSNLHQGGQPQKTTLTDQESELCQKIHQQSGLIYSGIDFLKTRAGPKFLEINPSPGFEGIEKIYDENIAEKIIEEFRT